MKGRRVAVVVNEWGKMGVDGSLLQDPAGFGISELAGGQIFCSCVAPAFLKALERLVALDVEAIFVETSGLAKPATVAQLAAEAEKRSGGRLAYRGLVCVVDALRFLVLRQAALAVNEQVAYADRFIVSKADLADQATLDSISSVLKEIRPDAPVTLRKGQPIPLDAVFWGPNLEPWITSHAPTPTHATTPALVPLTFDPRWNGWGSGGRPKSVSLVPDGPVDRRSLDVFLHSVSGGTWRIKGFVSVTGEGLPLFVDCVEDFVAVSTLPADKTAPDTLGLTLIWKTPPERAESVVQSWTASTGTGAHILA
jgi:G3E family GTPase